MAMQDAWVAFPKGAASGREAIGWHPYQLGTSNVRKFRVGIAAQDSSLATLEAQCNGAVPITWVEICVRSSFV